MTDVVDQDARRRIAEDHGATLFVEAGAGSGKTSSLVSRVVSLVLAVVHHGAELLHEVMGGEHLVGAETRHRASPIGTSVLSTLHSCVGRR